MHKIFGGTSVFGYFYQLLPHFQLITIKQFTTKGYGALLCYYVKLFLYFYVLFFTGRLFFYTGLILFKANPQFSQILLACKNALYLDTATICYAAILPCIFYTIYILLNKLLFYKIAKWIVGIYSLLWALISISEIMLYREWKSKLNIQAVLHLNNVDEVIKTASVKEIIIFAVAIIIALWFAKKWFNYLFAVPSISKPHKLLSFISMLLFLTASTIGLRGGLQPIPIQVSDACLHNNALYNDVAINPLFSFLANVRNYINNEKNNPFTNIEINVAQAKVDSLMILAKKSTTPAEKLWDNKIINKPNIVIIILEGISADGCLAFGGDNYMPHLNNICQQGLSFTNCYPSGHLSDMGNASILSGYPASPNVSVLMMPAKTASLPCINKPLQAMGYNSNYYFGGQLTYGNIKQYLISKAFSSVNDETNINSSQYKLQRLGINDRDMAKVFMDANNKSKQPFFNIWFTISTHNPYDIPTPIKNITTNENAYTNTLLYTDSVLKTFFEKASMQPWYKNTLFVLVSDHSHVSHKNRNIQEAAYHKIPLLFYGPALQNKWVGKKIDYTVSQLDIGYTLLESMDLPQELPRYTFSKSLFNTTTHFAPYTYFSGAGLVYDSSAACYDLRDLTKPAFEQNANTPFKELCKAFSAVNYEDYRKR